MDDVRYHATPAEPLFRVKVLVPTNGVKIILEADPDGSGVWHPFKEKDGLTEGNLARFDIHRGPGSVHQDGFLRAFAESSTGLRSPVSLNQGVLDYTTPGAPTFVE
jgi:hypothetical protein